MKIEIKHNFPDVARRLRELSDDISKRAMVSALNKTVAKAKTQMSREIRNEFNLKAADVSSSLKITKARASGGGVNLTAVLDSISRPGKRSLNMAHFAPRQTSKGVSVKIKRGGPRKIIEGAFLINNGKTLMIRDPGKRMASRSQYGLNKHSMAIKALQTLGYGQMFNVRRVKRAVLTTIEQEFPRIFAHEVDFYLGKFSRGG